MTSNTLNSSHSPNNLNTLKNANTSIVSPLITDYLKKILIANVYDVAVKTPLELAPILSEKLGRSIFFKREDTQSVFSFKLRGAFNKIVHLTEQEKKQGVIAASAGNHAQGVALSAKKLNLQATIVMPTTTPTVKIEAVKRLGAKVVLHGESFSDSYHHAISIKEQENLVFIHPFDDPEVIAGQGTIGLEIAQQATAMMTPIEAIFIAIGGGGLAAGVGAFFKAVYPDVKIIGVQFLGSQAMQQSLAQNHRICLEQVSLFSDGTAVKQVGEHTFALCKEVLDDIIVVDTDEVCTSIKEVFTETRSILEPAGALSVAAVKKYIEQQKKQHHFQDSNKNHGSLIAITCGANMNFDRLGFAADRANVGNQLECLVGVELPEQAGAFRQLCQLLAKTNQPTAITECHYRLKNNATKAHILLGFSTQSENHKNHVFQLLQEFCSQVIDLSHDDLSKQHLRHCIGGQFQEQNVISSNLNTSNTSNTLKVTSEISELLFEFQFPEKPGALMLFLSELLPHWNVSLFHYRYQGADYGKILVGLQVPIVDQSELLQSLQRLTVKGFPNIQINKENHPVVSWFL